MASGCGGGVEMLGRAGPWALTHLPWPSSRGLPRVLTDCNSSQLGSTPR